MKISCNSSVGKAEQANSRASRRAEQDRRRAAKAIERMSQNATEVFLIRHGETDWNVEHRIQGHLDPPLNANGRHQASQVASHLATEGRIRHIYSSDLQRCTETAAISAASLQLEVSTSAELRERNLGVLQGLTSMEAQNKEPEAWQLLVSGASDECIPGGGESQDDVFHRATSAVNTIATNHPGEVVAIFVHGGVLAQLHRRAAGYYFKGQNMNCSINRILIDGRTWGIIAWGDVNHLDGISYKSSLAVFGGGQNSG